VATHEQPEGHWDHAEFNRVKDDLAKVHDFLTRLAPIQFHTAKIPQRNYVAYLVIGDIAVIFEWLTNTKATRQVDRDSSRDTGPFWRFAETIWPVVFRNGAYGLSSAMKNWAKARKKFQEESMVIANIALRHPTWGVFKF
jgi:hypothetical protein